MTIFNKENMGLSYDIDELMDRIIMLKKKTGDENFFITDEEFTRGLKKDPSKASIKKLRGGGPSTTSLRVDS